MGKKTRYPGVVRRAPGRYRVRAQWTCPKTGKRRELERLVDATSASEAFRMRQLLLRSTRDERQRPRVRVADYAALWLRGKLPTLKRSTRRHYAEVLDNHVVPALGDYFMAALEHRDIVAWRNSMKKAPDTINGRLRILKAMFGDAMADLDLPRNPTSRVRSIPRRLRTKNRKVLTADELRRLLRAVREETAQWYPLVLALATTGARFGAVSALRWEDIDFGAMVIHIRRAQWKQHIDTTKTGAARTVPLAPELAQVLREHRRDLMHRQAPGFVDGWVFPSQTGRLHYQSVLRKPLDKAAEHAGLDRRVTAHSFRHTLNNLLRQVSQGEVQRSIIGHVTETMSEHYSQVAVVEKQAALGRALCLVSGGSPTGSGDPSGDRTGST